MKIYEKPIIEVVQFQLEEYANNDHIVGPSTEQGVEEW